VADGATIGATRVTSYAYPCAARDGARLAARRSAIKTISRYLIKIARLGGYLARANDGAPGNKVIWRGLSRLISIECAVASG
jgi:hypothetical protein